MDPILKGSLICYATNILKRINGILLKTWYGCCCGIPRTTPTFNLLSPLSRDWGESEGAGRPPLNVSDFFKSALFEGEEEPGGVKPCRGSTEVLVGREETLLLLAGETIEDGETLFLLLLIPPEESRAVRCNIKWTSDEYSPHFMSTWRI